MRVKRYRWLGHATQAARACRLRPRARGLTKRQRAWLSAILETGSPAVTSPTDLRVMRGPVAMKLKSVLFAEQGQTRLEAKDAARTDALQVVTDTGISLEA